MRLVQTCPLCDKPLVLATSHAVGDTDIREYKCGHLFTHQAIQVDESALDLSSVDGSKTARNYQRDGVEFILKSDFNCIIGDQMRLGKTPQSLLALKNAYAERTPCLILVRSANLWQWVREYKTWTDSLPAGIFPIQGTKSFIPPGFSAYIVSMDTFSRTGMSEKLMAFGFKLVIVDEAHSFKNTDSKRSQALIAFLREINRADLVHEVPFHCMLCKHQWMETIVVKINTMDAQRATTKRSQCEKCSAVVTQSAAVHVKVTRNCGVIMLTGTPLKNRADELFVPLNIVNPTEFPSLERFRRNWLMQSAQGKWSKVNPYALDRFKSAIAPNYLRREKEDVYKNLPAIERIFTVIEIQEESLKKAYNAVLDRMEREMHERSNYKFFDSIGDLMILRQICGMGKVKWTADYAEACLTDSERAKLAIGVHHHNVRDTLMYELSNLGAVKLDGEDSAEQKDYIAHKYFEKAPERILVLGMMAAKEGLELVYIPNALVLEREWSSADEEQFEYRFYNPDLEYLAKRGLENKRTTIEYIIAKGTIDEWFYDLVEEKRRIFGETLGSNWSLQDDAGSFKELIERTVSHRL